MRATIDPDNRELRGVLDALLREDVTITAREVARRHSLLKDASAFTRSAERKSLITEYTQRQNDARAVRVPAQPDVDIQSVNVAAEQKERILELEDQVRNLVAAHLGVIKAVQATGGMRALERFWSDYQRVANTLTKSGALPETAQVVSLLERTETR